MKLRTILIIGAEQAQTFGPQKFAKKDQSVYQLVAAEVALEATPRKSVETNLRTI
jgi:hypothetical protein